MLRRTSGLFMRKADVVALVPGAYLVATRYPGWVPVAGFFWLEVLPFTCLLYYSAGARALLFPLLHWLFLGLYELGYVANDRAGTSKERPARPAVVLRGGGLYWAASVRIVAWTLGIALCAFWLGAEAAWQFAVVSIMVVATLFLHTYIGTRSRRVSALRVLSFTALAFGKYAPAALALAPLYIVVPGLAWIFLLYGAGRVLDYSSRKLFARPFEMIDINALWYFAVLVPALGLIVCDRAVEGALTSLSIFGLYYLLLLIRRGGRCFGGQI